MNDCPLVPLGDRCIVEVLPEEKETQGGIILPEETVERQEMAKAEAILVGVGPEVRNVTSDWPEVGTTVLITKYAGVQYRPSPAHPDYRIVNWEDIVCWVRNERKAA